MVGGWPGCRAQDRGARDMPSLYEPCDHAIAEGGEGEKGVALGNPGSMLRRCLRWSGCQVGFGR